LAADAGRRADRQPRRCRPFLYDWRRTLADLIASEHYGTVAQVAHAAGLKVYGEALEDNRPMLGDDMAMRSRADVPMAALWTFTQKGPEPVLSGRHERRCQRGASSMGKTWSRLNR
jgi:hypothetical protein